MADTQLLRKAVQPVFLPLIAKTKADASLKRNMENQDFLLLCQHAAFIFLYGVKHSTWQILLLLLEDERPQITKLRLKLTLFINKSI